MSADRRLPYPGLRAFSQAESDLFFGRESCVDTMIDRLSATRFLAVLGASGSGKSSLVRTGLFDALQLGFLADAGSRWRIIDCHPGGRPTGNLAAALVASSAERAEDPTGIALLGSFLGRGPRSLIEWCSSGHLAPGENLLVFVDQCEELFRYEGYSQREEAEAFVALLIESARSREASIFVVLTMRSEYLGACPLLPGLAERVNDGMYLVTRMTREECRAAIEGPAGVAGFAIENALVNRLLNDLESFAPWEREGELDQLQSLSRRADQLPLMQHMLNRLWLVATARSSDHVVLTLADYERVGGIRGALDGHAVEILSGLTDSERSVAEPVFRALVSGLSIQDAVRRPCRFDGLARLTGNRADTAALINAFRAPTCNFLRPSLDEPLDDHTIVDIGHESLIRQWTSFSEWFEKEAKAAQRWQRLLFQMKEHQDRRGDLLAGLELANVVDWWAEQPPTEPWAERYGDHFAEVEDFLERSKASAAARIELDRKQGRERAKADRLKFNLLAVLFGGLVMFMLAYLFERQREASQEQRATLYAKSGQKILLQVSQLITHQASNEDVYMSGIGEHGFFSGSADPKQGKASNNVSSTAPEAKETDQVVLRLKNIERDLNERDSGQELDKLVSVGLISLIVGSVHLSHDRHAEAVASYQEAAAQLEKAVKSTNDVDLQMVLGSTYDRLAMTLLGLSNFDESQSAVRKEYDIDRQISAANPGNPQIQQLLAVKLEQISDIYRSKHRLADALQAVQEEVAIGRALVVSDRKDVAWLYFLGVALERTGTVQQAQGDLPAALASFREEAELGRKLVDIDGQNSDFRRVLGVALEKIGVVQQAQNALPLALKSFDEEVEVGRTLVRMDPADDDAQHLLGVALEKRGGVLAAQSTLPGALAAFQEEVSIGRALVAKDPANGQAQRLLGVALEKVGSVLEQQQDLAGALKAYEDEVRIGRWLTAKEPANGDAQRFLGVALERSGGVLFAQRNLPDALKACQDEVTIGRTLVALDPQNGDWQRLLGVALERTGAVLEAQTNLPEALKAFREEVGVARTLVAMDASNADWAGILRVALERTGLVRQAQGSLPDALTSLQEAVEIDKALLAKGPSDVETRRVLAVHLEEAGTVLQAMGDLPGALEDFKSEVEIARLLVAAQAKADRRRILAASLQKLGTALQAGNALADALAAFRESADIARAQVAEQPASADWRAILGAALDKTGGVLRAQNDLPGAQAAFQEEVDIDRKLLADSPDDVVLRQALGPDWEELGSVLQARTMLPEALKAFQEEVDIARVLVAKNAANADGQHFMQRALGKLGGAQQALNNLPEALKAFQEEIEIGHAIAARDPADADGQRLLHDAVGNAGAVMQLQSSRAQKAVEE